jgi:Spy/CpxP family protein refolding chaperone
MKQLCAIILALVLVGFSAVLFAAPPDTGCGCPGTGATHQWAHPHRQFGSFLNLTEEQRGKMKEIRQRFWADVHDFKYDIRIKNLEVRKLFTDPKTDDATLLAKEKELNNLKLKLMDRKAEMKVEWRKILTPEQIRMLDRIHHHWGHRHSGHRHWRHHHGHRGSMDKDRGPMDKGSESKPAASMSH